MILLVLLDCFALPAMTSKVFIAEGTSIRDVIPAAAGIHSPINAQQATDYSDTPPHREAQRMWNVGLDPGSGPE